MVREPRVSRRQYLLVVALSLVVFVTGTLTWLVHATNDHSSTTATSATRKLAPAPYAVTLSLNAPGGRATLGARLLAVADAVGPLKTIELWDGGVRTASVPASSSRGGRAEFTWTPLRPGPHLLTARGVGDKGTATSAPVAISVFRPRVNPKAILIPAGGGVTAASVAAQAGVPVSKVTTAPPGPAGSGPPPFTIDPIVLTGNPGKGPIIETNPPLAKEPSLTATADAAACTVTLTASGLTGAGVIYEASGTGGGPTQIAEVNGDGATTVDHLGPGTHVFSLAESGKPITGLPVAVTFGDVCKQSWWTGDATLVDGILTVPKAADNMYVYISVDDQPFDRIPQSPYEFLPGSTHLDVTKYLPSLTGSVIRLEVWAGLNPAEKIATAEAHLPDGTTVTDLIGESTLTVIASPDSKVLPNADEVTFQWATGNTHATGVFWQVMGRPISQDEQSLGPIGLIATGVAPVGEIPSGLMDGAAKGGTFTLAPSVLLGKPSLDTDPSGIPIVPGNQVWVRVVPISNGQPLGATSPTVTLDKPNPTKPPTTAMNLTASAFDGGRSGNPALAGCIRVTKVPWTPEHAWDPPSTDPVTSQWWTIAPFYPVPGTYCMSDFPPSEDSDCGLGPLCDVGEAFVGAITDGVNLIGDTIGPVWDYIAQAYNGLIDLAATAIAKLNPLCLSASAASAATGSSAAGDAAATCEKLGKVAAKAGIATVLAFYGLPPSLPTTDQLAALADGHMVDFSIEMLKELGVPCDDLQISPDDAAKAQAAGVDVPSDGVDVCRRFAEEVLNTVQAQAKVQAQQTVSAVTGLPAPGVAIDGFDMTLEPRQNYRNPSLFVKADPVDSNAPVDGVCPVTWTISGYGAAPTHGMISRWSTTTWDPADAGLDVPWNNPDDNSGSGGPVTTYSWASWMNTGLANDPGVSHTIHGQLTSNDCLTGTPATLYGTVAPPLGRWAPGQSE